MFIIFISLIVIVLLKSCVLIFLSVLERKVHFSSHVEAQRELDSFEDKAIAF